MLIGMCAACNLDNSFQCAPQNILKLKTVFSQNDSPSNTVNPNKIDNKICSNLFFISFLFYHIL